MTTAEIIDKLRKERDVGSRFPVRIIFVEDLYNYSSLISKLKTACDQSVNIADYAKRDVVPQFDKLRENLATYTGQQILLLSVGEYLRMCIKREINRERTQFLPFWEHMQEEGSKTRYILPMFCCRDCFDRIVGKVDERQEDFIWQLDENKHTSSNVSINIYSPEFSRVIKADANNFEEWLRNWDIILLRDKTCKVITSQYRNAETTYGNIKINIIDSPFAYISNNIADINKLNSAWESDEFWINLAPLAINGCKFSDIVFDQLNIANFDFVSVISRWKMLNLFQRELIWLWYRVYPTDEYFSYACNKAEFADEIPDRIRDEILLIKSKSPAWINERQQAMKALSFDAFDDKYFKALEDEPMLEVRLKLLTYKTHEEQAFAVKTVSSMLRNGVEPDEAVDCLMADYPSLGIYLKGTSGLNIEVDKYFTWYKKNKLINRFPEVYPKHINFEQFDSRFKQLHKMRGKDCFTFWIDGFGVEWLPVFLKELEIRGIFPDSQNIATAKLPTETEYNHQWDVENPMEEKWTGLDSLSHEGLLDDKSYFSCIAYQLAVFSEAAKRVDDLLNEHEYVAITGDHGSSRLAALAFHSKNVVPIVAPNRAVVRCLGRFCELENPDATYPLLDFMEITKLDNKTYIVMNDYNHFKASGNVAGGNTDEQDIVGEIHGGNTAEERLVPVVIVKREHPHLPIKCTPKSNYASCHNGHIEIILLFNLEITELEVCAGNIQGICKKNPDGTWTVSFDGVTSDEIMLLITANNNLLSDSMTLKVKKQGISKNDNMGGLP